MQFSHAPRSLLAGLLAALVVCTVAHEACARPTAVDPDKLSHFAFGVPCGAGGTILFNQFAPSYRLVGGAVIGTAPGLLVEILDSTSSAGFSAGDLLADFVGSALGAVLTDQIVLRFWFDNKGKGGGVEVGAPF